MSNCPYCNRPMEEQGSRSGKGPYRAQDGRKLLGVCAGIADYFGWSRVWVRVAAVILLFVAFPATVIGYIIAALIMEPDNHVIHGHAERVHE